MYPSSLSIYPFPFPFCQSQVVELEGEVAQVQLRLRQRNQEVERIGEVASKLTQERDSVADIVRQEFADRYVQYSVQRES